MHVCTCTFAAIDSEQGPRPECKATHSHLFHHLMDHTLTAASIICFHVAKVASMLWFMEGRMDVQEVQWILDEFFMNHSSTSRSPHFHPGLAKCEPTPTPTLSIIGTGNLPVAC
mmetsp:Transcript_70288/g.123900  ORF Transcript_70288/g.123900 Transcript_70288/m.123900 type:complete len:114 (-) Transcript_70288:227-568(-)